MTPTRVVLITGASSGLGAEMARQFAALGYDLALGARRIDALEALRTDIVARHPDRRVEVRALDVTDDDAVFATFRGFAADFGRIDRFVINAGIADGGALGTGHWPENRATLMTNVVAAFAQTEAAMELLRAQRSGHLVMISSVAAVRGLPRGMATYAASKAAVAHLVEGLRIELHGTPITTTVLYPGYIVSGLNPDPKANRLLVSTEKGVTAMVAAIEAERPEAAVPPWPWRPLARVLAHAPVSIVRRMV